MQKIRENLNFQTYFGIGFVLVLGTFSHFFYEWSGENRLVGIFAAVNESTWEHLKLLFFPALLFWVLEWIFGKKKPNLLWSVFWGLFAGTLSIVVLFYTYSGVLGKNLAPVDILSFVVGVLVAFFVKLYAQSGTPTARKRLAGGILLAVLLLCYLLFTAFPPHIGLFLDPVTGTYGFPV